MSKANNNHSQMLIGILNGSTTITNALFQLKTILSILKDASINKWIDGELNGYADNNDVPTYRIVKAPLYGRVRQVGFGKIIDQTINIPVKIDKLDYLEIKLRDNITAIEKWSIDESEKRNMPVDLRIANMIADIEISNFCQITNAWLPLPSSSCLEIINSVKSRIIDILLMLEENGYDIDKYYVALSSDKEKQKDIKIINNIIYSDNSISIGDKNSISNSAVGNKNKNGNQNRKK